MKPALILFWFSAGMAWSQGAPPSTAAGRACKERADRAGDKRCDFEADAYLGLAVDAFTAQAQRDVLYGNPQDNGDKRERMIGGFEFSYRLYGKIGSSRAPQLWLYGKTLHGVRSAEVDCSPTGEARPPVCAISDNALKFQPDPAKQLVYLLRNASSMEAHTGFRFEFLHLNPLGDNPARLYFKAEAGFFSIARSGGDVFDVHRVALGALSTGGRFAGSYFEVGYGRNDAFRIHRYRRGVVDGMLTWGTSKKVRPFVRMALDSDVGKGADSIQTFMGLTFDLSQIF